MLRVTKLCGLPPLSASQSQPVCLRLVLRPVTTAAAQVEIGHGRGFAVEGDAQTGMVRVPMPASLTSEPSEVK